MTGFESKRQASLDTIDHMPYQGRPSRPDELAQPAPAPAYTEGHCEWKAKKGGCPLHNLHCGYPACDRRPAAPAVAEPLKDWEFVAMWATAAETHADKYDTAVEFGRAVESRHGIKGSV